MFPGERFVRMEDPKIHLYLNPSCDKLVLSFITSVPDSVRTEPRRWVCVVCTNLLRSKRVSGRRRDTRSRGGVETEWRSDVRPRFGEERSCLVQRRLERNRSLYRDFLSVSVVFGISLCGTMSFLRLGWREPYTELWLRIETKSIRSLKPIQGSGETRSKRDRHLTHVVGNPHEKPLFIQFLVCRRLPRTVSHPRVVYKRRKLR